MSKLRPKCCPVCGSSRVSSGVSGFRCKKCGFVSSNRG